MSDQNNSERSFTPQQLARIEYNRILALDLIDRVFRDRPEREELERRIVVAHNRKNRRRNP
jgi:hypothetical protein